MNRTILSQTKFRFFFALWWMICIFQGYQALKDNKVETGTALTDCILSCLLLAGLCLFINVSMRYYLPRQEKYWYLLVTSFGLSGIWLAADLGLLTLIFRNDTSYRTILGRSSGIRYGAAFLVLSCMNMISLLFYTQLEQKEMDERNEEAERLAKEAELFKLRQQLQPHFLFNSLNSISALTGSDPVKARHMIQQLSDFLRGTLRKDEAQWNSLEEELLYLGLYLDIEKVRFGHRLQTRIDCSDDSRQLRLPAMLLQPVVENAIKFGLYDTTGEVLISINSDRKENYLNVIITNPYDPETATPLKGTGFGLSSIQRRLFLLFARTDLLQTTRHENIFRTQIRIPQNYVA